MKIICDGLDLSDAVNKVNRALPNKIINPVLEGIKITAKEGKLTVFASDTELAIEKTINADVIEEGSVLVPGRFFSEYIRKLTNEQVELFTNEKSQLRIKYSNSEGFVQLYNTDDYPLFSSVQKNTAIKILQRELKDTIEKTIFSVSTDDSRPTLKGCLLEFDNLTLTTVALDGYRLALNKKPLEEKTEAKKIIIPSRGLGEIAKLLNEDDSLAQIYIDENYVLINLSDTVITARLINGEFINYKQILPQDFVTNIVVDKKQFEDSLERASLPSKQEKNNLVKLEIKENMMSINGTSELSNIRENVSISLKGKDLIIAFNARFLADCLRVINTEFIRINFTSSVSPTIITPGETDESLYLVLPVRMIN